MNDKINLEYSLNSAEPEMQGKCLTWIQDYFEDISKMIAHLIDEGFEITVWKIDISLNAEYEQT